VHERHRPLPGSGKVVGTKFAEKGPCRRLHAQAAWQVPDGQKGMQIAPLATVCMPFSSSSNRLWPSALPAPGIRARSEAAMGVSVGPGQVGCRRGARRPELAPARPGTSAMGAFPVGRRTTGGFR
jgi:hypothetical protein